MRLLVDQLARRELLRAATAALAGSAVGCDPPVSTQTGGQRGSKSTRGSSRPIVVFLSGDVMLGRGIDQILPHSSDPELHESFVQNALEYVRLAERENGRIPRKVGFEYVWGDALAELERARPHARIVNLETAVTRSGNWLPKGINYRMHPGNVACLTQARIDCCVLANNHVLDYNRAGLDETLATLHDARIQTAGAGHDWDEACAPAIVSVSGDRRVIVFALASLSSGVPSDWAATKERAGVRLLEGASENTVAAIAKQIEGLRREGDVVMVSIHWGGNWGYSVSREQRALAHALIDEAGVDLIHGHSSHHPKGIEVYRDKLILYGAGDLLNDYEGISGHAEYRSELSLMYLVRLSAVTGKLEGLRMIPMQVKRLRLNRARAADARWLRDTLDRESQRFGSRVELDEDEALALRLT